MIYLDYAATTPLHAKALQDMQDCWRDRFGNPSSIHFEGQMAEAALQEGRAGLAGMIHAGESEIVFNSGGSESDNLAVRGVAWARCQSNKKHLLISPVEHPAVMQTARQLVKLHGFELEFLPVDGYGQVNPDDVAKALRPDTALVSVIYASNEIGTINPIAEIGAVCRGAGVPFHSDAVQAAAHLKLDVTVEQVDLLSIGAHKFYGPRGVGALYVRKGTPILPMQTGGSQEHGLRAGTENVAGIVGMVEALRLTLDGLEERNLRLVQLRDRLIAGVLGSCRARLTGHPQQRLPNHASFVFEGVDGNFLVALLDQAGFACSSGSACKVGNPQPSEVLLALGLTARWALGSLRVTLGRETNEAQIDAFLSVLPALVERAVVER